MKHAEALRQAVDAYNALAPYCNRLEIAGSIRRQRPEVKDVELV
jgi:DNA polymerase/3'-5' exonuclease PolX